MLQPEFEEAWIDVRSIGKVEAQGLLRPYPYSALEFYPVSTFVNAPRNDGPECIAPKVNLPRTS